jgi:hypothetical protein
MKVVLSQSNFIGVLRRMSVTYTATLTVREETVLFVSSLLHAERQRRGTRTGTRALSCFKQAILVIRWFLDGTRVAQLAGDNTIGRSTAYDYLHEVSTWAKTWQMSARSILSGCATLMATAVITWCGWSRRPMRRSRTPGWPGRFPATAARGIRRAEPNSATFLPTRQACSEPITPIRSRHSKPS